VLWTDHQSVYFGVLAVRFELTNGETVTFSPPIRGVEAAAMARRIDGWAKGAGR
jgi:hypothetical protein